MYMDKSECMRNVHMLNYKSVSVNGFLKEVSDLV
jgi:hypothetical protein